MRDCGTCRLGVDIVTSSMGSVRRQPCQQIHRDNILHLPASSCCSLHTVCLPSLAPLPCCSSIPSHFSRLLSTAKPFVLIATAINSRTTGPRTLMTAECRRIDTVTCIAVGALPALRTVYLGCKQQPKMVAANTDVFLWDDCRKSATIIPGLKYLAADLLSGYRVSSRQGLPVSSASLLPRGCRATNKNHTFTIVL